MSLNDLKKELEAALLITKWSPSDEQLKLIANRLKSIKDRQDRPTKSEIEEIVLGVVGSYEALLLKGIDNSDLTTLLLLATKSNFTND